MFDSAMGRKIFEVDVFLAVAHLAALPAAEIGEERVWILDEAPDPDEKIDWFLEIRLCWTLIFDIRWPCEYAAEKCSHADDFHGLIEVIHVDVAATAFDVAMVSQGVDYGTGTSAGIRRRRSIFSLRWLLGQ